MSNFNNNDQKLGVAVGFIFGFALAMVISVLPFSDLSKAHRALAECEKSLPRYQHCKITAIPIEEENVDNNGA